MHLCCTENATRFDIIPLSFGCDNDLIHILFIFEAHIHCINNLSHLLHYCKGIIVALARINICLKLSLVLTQVTTVSLKKGYQNLLL